MILLQPAKFGVVDNINLYFLLMSDYLLCHVLKHQSKQVSYVKQQIVNQLFLRFTNVVFTL